VAVPALFALEYHGGGRGTGRAGGGSDDERAQREERHAQGEGDDDAEHHLGLAEVNVVGTDIGAMVAHAWALAHPGEMRRLVLSEAFLPGFGLEEHMNPATGGSWHFGFHAQVDLAAMLTAGKEEEYLGGYWAMMTAGGLTEQDRAELLRAYRAPDGMRGGFEHYATLTEDGRAARAAARLAMPVLVLNGEHGLPQQILLDGARQAATDVRADIVPAAGHTLGADNPDWLAERLARFFTTDTAA
jgi:pimeloyl-ACP methyl ester carboxylesterase